MSSLFPLLFLLPVHPAQTLDAAQPHPDEAGTGPSSGFVIERGEGRPQLVIPRDETLVYRVYIDIALVEASVGTVSQRSAVEPYRPSVLGSPDKGAVSTAEAGETVTIELLAKGDYKLYSMDSSIETKILPQAWPRVTYYTNSRGTEQRRRRIELGLRDGEPSSSYRRDTSRGAPKGQRIWCKPGYRTVPEDTLDMLSGMMMTRALIREGRESLSFPLIDKQRVWDVTLRRGERKRVKTDAGLFDAVEVRLEAGPYAGEVIEEEKIERFEGLFGLDGGGHLWVEERTGIPIYIQGDLPVGPITLGIEVVLESFAGTPEGFGPR